MVTTEDSVDRPAFQEPKAKGYLGQCAQFNKMMNQVQQQQNVAQVKYFLTYSIKNERKSYKLETSRIKCKMKYNW